jgi:succinoglycan biosynthesis protein ExoA
MPEPPPFVTAILPTLNEEGYLEACVRSLVDGGHPPNRLELLVVDGGSTDATRAIARRLGDELPAVRLLDNPGRLQASAFNIGMREADPRATYVLRCDVHAEYPTGFVGRAVSTAERTGAVLVAFSDAPGAHGCFQTAVAFAQSTPAGVGDARYRLGGWSGWVDHGKHGCFLRSAVEAAGGYDEGFSHNEDSELSLRLREAGGGVWLDEELVVTYYPRDSLRGLARQYWLYGRGRASTCLKHDIAPQPRQLAPVLLVPWHVATLIAARRRPMALLAPAAYLAALGAIGAAGAIGRRDRCLLLAPAALATMHHAWGAGFSSRWLPGAVSKRRSRRTAPRP